MVRARVSGLGFSQTLVLDKCLPEGFHFNPIGDDDDGWESVYTQDLFQNLHNFEDKNNISDYAQNKVWRKRWVPPSHNRSVSKIPLFHQGAARGSTNNSENHAGSSFLLKSRSS